VVTSLEKLPGISPATVEFAGAVREYMRDQEGLNRLVAGYESSDRQILWATRMMLSQFNLTPPFSQYRLEDLMQQHDLLMLLIEMTDIILTKGVVKLQMRNHINFSTGGTSVGITDKAPLYMKWLDRQEAQTTQMLQRVKTAMNIESILGETGAHSEYWAINGIYF
jgi:hypothetical protein